MAQDDENQYLVLARKYRPQNFDDLIGQDALVQTFTNAIKNNRLHHAYILTGIRGIGKTTTARIMAKALNCTGLDGNSGPTIHPCGVCENCRAIAEDRHIDVIELDAASRTGVDDMREILDGVRYKPTLGRYKVYIIDEVHMLSKNAFNALLKTLEEPPSHVKFIFATTEIRKVPVTVLSRCQRFDLQRLSIEDLLQLFHRILEKENISAEEEALEIVAKAADGSARDGLSLLDQAISVGDGKISTSIVKKMIGLVDKNKIFELFSALLQGNLQNVLENLQNQYKNGANPQSVLTDLIDVAHTLIKAKIVPESVNAIGMSENEKNMCRELSGSVSVAVLSKIWQMLIKGLSELQIAPVQLDALEMILIRVAYSSNLPTPLEILNDVKKKSDLTPPPVYQARNEAKKVEVLTKEETVISAPQKAAAQEQKPVVEPLITAETPAENPEFSLENLVSYLEEHKKMMLLYSLKNDVSFSKFERGLAKIRLSSRVSRDFLVSLRNILAEASGYDWIVEVESGALGETIADAENARNEANKKSVQEYPIVKAILSEFRGANIETLTRKAEKEDNEEIFYEEENIS